MLGHKHLAHKTLLMQVRVRDAVPSRAPTYRKARLSSPSSAAVVHLGKRVAVALLGGSSPPDMVVAPQRSSLSTPVGVSRSWRACSAGPHGSHDFQPPLTLPAERSASTRVLPPCALGHGELQAHTSAAGVRSA